MPTKPHRQKHFTLDEAIAKSTYHAKPVTRNRALLAALLAIPLGCTGIHNFIMRRKKRGMLHLLISSVAFGMFFFPLIYVFAIVYRCQHENVCVDIKGYDDLLNVIVISGLVIFGASIIWGIVEGVILLINIGRFPVSTDKS